MTAVVKTEAGKGARLVEIPVPQPGKNEVVVRVKAAAICGTDMHIYEWNTWAQNAKIKLPLVMGHEFSGEVAAVGEGVTTLKTGDYIAGETHIPCGECYQCKNGLQHICGRLTIYGVNTDGCFSRYTRIPEACAIKIPPTIPPEIGAILEPLGTSFRSCLELQVTGATVAVIGAGPIGLLAVVSARAMGAAAVIAVDVILSRLELALKVGANYTFNPKEQDVVQEILKLTGGLGVDGFIDASGNSKAIQEGFKYLRKGGRAALVGLPSGPLCIDLGADVVFKEAVITGIHGRKMFETWTGMKNMLDKKRLPVEPIITHVLPLESFEEGFNLLKTGEACKVVLIP
ncbi:MAG: L-threonine 3-dehydrogenase [Peptococcaceae bacterium]|jgi:threonine 3-dehydrogenase|nr:L-threonine 3-dehydrogenase [Peptococcaceae bacterium]MDH7526415.1 L-threonine 3-dehydrogenase [Peptococcaceae bacterium]